tara:strand:+ start:750 stop:1700 length:951 start_codon:yes stop_codon:yes gene_type:complete
MKQSSIFSFVRGAGLEPGTDVVDLFCGIGGFSCGAVVAGHRVVLAVDADPLLLGCHIQNHPHCRHICTQLPDELSLPTEGRWHLHGSPPCQKLSIMQSVPDTEELEHAVDLVAWFLFLVERTRPTTWSMEQVNHESVRGLLVEFKRKHPLLCDWESFNAADYGVPQQRKRIIAGSPVIINGLRNSASPDRRPCVRDFIPDPPRPFVRTALYRRPAYIKKTETSPPNKHGPYVQVPLCDQIRTVDEVGWTILATGWKAWCDAEGNMLRHLTGEECALLQTFPVGYVLPFESKLKMIGVGNAIPPAFARAIMRPTLSR